MLTVKTETFLMFNRSQSFWALPYPLGRTAVSLRRPPGSRINIHLSRSFSTSRSRSAYVRFSVPGQPKSPRNPYDFRTWDTRVQVAAVLATGGAVYYLTQWVFLITLCERFEPLVCQALNKYRRREGGDSWTHHRNPKRKYASRSLRYPCTLASLLRI